MQPSILLDLQYFPCIDYMALLLKNSSFVIEAEEHFIKQSYRNRCYIKGANQTLMLCVPVEQGSQKTPIKDVKVDYKQNWYDVHWRSIQSAYGKTPFFEYYGEYFEKVIMKKPTFLWDLNSELLHLLLRFLDIPYSFQKTDKFLHSYPETEYVDLRSAIHPKKEHLFLQPPYQQAFGEHFEPNLSILDLLFMQGNYSKLYLYKLIEGSKK